MENLTDRESVATTIQFEASLQLRAQTGTLSTKSCLDPSGREVLSSSGVTKRDNRWPKAPSGVHSTRQGLETWFSQVSRPAGNSQLRTDQRVLSRIYRKRAGRSTRENHPENPALLPVPPYRVVSPFRAWYFAICIVCVLRPGGIVGL